jgi:carbon monoxide dehydrogenase subunit G
MDHSSYFESRTGTVSANAKAVFNFVTDMSNFERFVPDGTINNWKAEKDNCSFGVSMIGTVTVRLAEKEEFIKVVYRGDALKKNDFILTLDIYNHSEKPADVKVSLQADLNPIMKMMAAKPIEQFLGMLVNEMEKFREWDKVTG